MADTKKEAAATFSKAQLLASKRYANRRDALYAILDDDKEYSHADVEKALVDFMKKKG